MFISRRKLTKLIREVMENRLDANQGELHQIRVGEVPIKAQIVDDLPSRKKGLMFRQTMPDDEGMLFIHDTPDVCSYYMKNTYIPLSIAFADEDGVIFQIEDMNPGDVNNVKSIQPALYALEMNQGWFNNNNILIGNEIIF